MHVQSEKIHFPCLPQAGCIIESLCESEIIFLLIIRSNYVPAILRVKLKVQIVVDQFGAVVDVVRRHLLIIILTNPSFEKVKVNISLVILV